MKLLLVLAILPLFFISTFAEQYDFSLSNIKLTDKFDEDIDIVEVNQHIKVGAEITNNFPTEQQFAYLVYANNDNFNRVAWTTGSLAVNQSYTPSLSFILEKTGTYQNMVFVLDSIDAGYRNLLAPTYNISFTTGIDSTKTNENNFAFTPISELSPYSELTLNTNLEIFHSDSIIITGNVSELPQIGIPSVVLFVKDSERSIVYVNAVTIKSDWTYEFEIDSSIFEIGEHELIINSGDDSITSSILILNKPPQIQIFTDKSSYNEIDTISITGQINGLETLPTDNITITIHDKYDNIFIPEISIPITNDIFSHDIITDGIAWGDYIGNITISASIQNHTASTTIHYSSYPVELSLEFLHDNITDNTYMMNDMYTTHNTLITTLSETDIQHNSSITTLQNQTTTHDTLITILSEALTEQDEFISTLSETITILNEQINELQRILDEIREIPPIADAPIIIEVYYFDVNHDGEYSAGDKITILFDSNTNSAGGRIVTNIDIDNMFTFTESIGTIYRGTWQTPTTFVITLNNVNNAGPPVIGTTTVTPTGIIPILSTDKTSLPSTVTSPVMILADKEMFRLLFN